MEHPKQYRFKTWHLVLNLSVNVVVLGVGLVLLPWSIWGFEWSLTGFLMVGLGLAILYTGIEELFQNVVPFFPRLVALELHPDHLVVASGNGPIKVPRKAVRGCKEPQSTQIGKRGGRVEVSVRDEFKIRHWTGRKVNPSFHGMSVIGEDAVTLVRAIRDWRKAGKPKAES